MNLKGLDTMNGILNMWYLVQKRRRMCVEMRARGIGFVRLSNGTKWITAGACWQCSGCKLVMVTQGDLYQGTMSTIGRYGLMPCTFVISGYGADIDPPKYYGTCNSNTMSGYKFRLS